MRPRWPHGRPPRSRDYGLIVIVPDVMVRVPSENCSVNAPVPPLKVSPLNVATPDAIVAVAPESVAPDPDAMVAVIVPLAVVTTFPPTSRTVITGCVASAMPVVPVAEGGVLMTSDDGAPRVRSTDWVAE